MMANRRFKFLLWTATIAVWLLGLPHAARADVTVEPDPTFSSDGKLITILSYDGFVDPNHRPAEVCAGVAVQSDGKIVVAGSAVALSGDIDIGVARYNVDGTLDASFVARQRAT